MIEDVCGSLPCATELAAFPLGRMLGRAAVGLPGDLKAHMEQVG
jgi:hypothetical protein